MAPNYSAVFKNFQRSSAFFYKKRQARTGLPPNFIEHNTPLHADSGDTQ
jgi:hypothetical protein